MITFDILTNMLKIVISLIIIAVLVVGSYIYVSKPDGVVVSEQGNVEGVVNKARAWMQGKRFWKLQLKLATAKYNESIAPHLPSSAEMQELYRKLRKDQDALNEKMKPLYTPEEQEANQLRIKADSIEMAGKWRSLDTAAVAVRTRDTEKYKILIPVIEARLHTGKP
jgi:hypothetical protein